MIKIKNRKNIYRRNMLCKRKWKTVNYFVNLIKLHIWQFWMKLVSKSDKFDRKKFLHGMTWHSRLLMAKSWCFYYFLPDLPEESIRIHKNFKFWLSVELCVSLVRYSEKPFSLQNACLSIYVWVCLHVTQFLRTLSLKIISGIS